MNKTDFSHIGGFPFETETLERMQEAYDIFQAFGELVGTKSIVKGCIQTSNNVSDGVIYWDGELLPFVGGGLQSKIKIVEVISSAEFEDGEVKPIHYKRHAAFGSGTDAILWTEFKRAYPITSGLYLDKVDMYAGALNQIPTGWHLCDGSNGTVDLRGRFVVGLDPSKTDYNEVGKNGGTEEVVLLKQNLPSYNLTKNLSTSSKTVNGKYIGDDGDGWPDGSTDRTPQGVENSYLRDSETLVIPSLPVNGTISSGGSNEAHENRPPFYTLAYIQFKGI